MLPQAYVASGVFGLHALLSVFLPFDTIACVPCLYLAKQKFFAQHVTNIYFELNAAACWTSMAVDHVPQAAFRSITTALQP